MTDEQNNVQANEVQMEQEDAQATEPKAIHHQTVRAADLAISRKEISQESHRAVLEGRITLAEAKELGRDNGPDGPVGQSTKRASKQDRTPTETPCLCGCGELTARRFRPGHDQRAKGMIMRAVRAGTLDGLSEELQEYARERDLIRQTEQRMADEEAKKAEKAKAKADAQRAKEGAAEKK